MSLLDTAHSTLSSFYNTPQVGSSSGTVNELSSEDLKRRRNKQLAIGITLVVIVVGSIVLYNYFKTKKNK